uniref:VWFA domain-containing protein n=1 Tax=Esox lucius TaxID=8010 RepID=A0A6Q2XA41_ESOLU
VQMYCIQVDVVFLLDGSYKMQEGVQSIRDFLGQFAEHLAIGPEKAHLAVIQYSDKPTTVFLLNTYTSKGDVMAEVRNINLKGGRPLNTGEALDYVKNYVFTSTSGSRLVEGIPQILILLSGGKSEDDVLVPSQRLKAAGIVIFTVGVKDADEAEMQSIAHSPNQAFMLREFSDLSPVKQQLLSTQFAQVRSQEQTKLDIVFLLDGSDNTRKGFPAIRDFLYKMIENFYVEQKKDRVAVIQYSNVAVANFYLNSFLRKEDMLNSVRGLSHKGGRPLNTGAALKFVKENVFTSSSGSRYMDGVKQILILLSSGRSRDNVDEPASALKEFGVLVVGIGTKSSDSRELHNISHDSSFVLTVSELIELPEIQQQLLSTMTRAIKWASRKDIVFVLDGSDGTRSGFPAMRDFVEGILEKIKLEKDRDRVSVVQYSREPGVHFYFNTYRAKKDIVNTVRGLKHKGGRPLNTGAALQYVIDNVFTASSGCRRLEGVPQLLILLSGGRSFDNVDTPAAALKELGVKVFAIGTRSSDSREMQRISQDPSHAMSVSDFTDLPIVVGVITETPTILGMFHHCDQRTDLCNLCLFSVDLETARKDVVFLLDGSDGTRSGFPAMRDFVQRVVEKLTVEENRDRVSVVQYSREPEANFYLNTYTTKENVVDAVTGLRHKGGRPLNTGAALQYVRDNVFTASSGSRRLDGVPQLLILLSGGRSFDNVDTPAAALKELGVRVFGIGTRSSDKREMQRISQDPSYALSVSEFTDLPSIQQQLLSSFSRLKRQQTPDLSRLIFNFYLSVDLETARKDVVFLLDGSDGTRSGFPAMRDFVQRVVEKFTVEENRDRVSVVQYSREPENHFNLNTYTTKEDIVATIEGIRHKGGRPLNTGAALQHVRDNVFNASSGSRHLEGVPQILILLNGGRSFDNVNTPASALKKLGVKVFAVGTRSSDIRELQKISYNPRFALSVSEFTDLPNVQQQLMSALGSVIVQDISRAPSRDVVFLLDGSDGTRAGFPAMRDFVQRVVETLAVDENKDRVALVQYSRDPAAQFYLNTFNTKDDIVNTVRGLRHKGGRPLNTGAALQYVRDNIFTASSGSRSLQGIPQMLILLSGGRSNDNVDVSASALKESGVLIFGIGTRNSSREVERIVTDPSYSQSVSEFTDIARVQESLVSRCLQLEQGALIAEKCRGYHKIPVKQCLSRISQTFRASSSNCYPLWKQWLLELLQKPQQF